MWLRVSMRMQMSVWTHTGFDFQMFGTGWRRDNTVTSSLGLPSPMQGHPEPRGRIWRFCWGVGKLPGAPVCIPSSPRTEPTTREHPLRCPAGWCRCFCKRKSEGWPWGLHPVLQSCSSQAGGPAPRSLASWAALRAPGSPEKLKHPCSCPGHCGS